jgi:hypothetical protein
MQSRAFRRKLNIIQWIQDGVNKEDRIDKYLSKEVWNQDEIDKLR